MLLDLRSLEESGSGANASGVTVVVNASIVAGIATGGANHAGVTITDADTIVPGVATGGANVSGKTITDTTSVIAGDASGGANRDGVTITVSDIVVSGIASGGAGAGNVTITESGTIESGIGSGGAQASGDTITVSINVANTPAIPEAFKEEVSPPPPASSGVGQIVRFIPIPGHKYPWTKEEGFALGRTITVRSSIEAGTASAGAKVSGITMARAKGDTITSITRVIPGKASGVVNLSDEEELILLLAA